MSPRVAIVGRPNVGKSTLFNRLVGRKMALVDDTPGVTRDRREGAARLHDLEFTVIDTAGLEEAAPESLAARMRAQTEVAVTQADIILFVVDARVGVTTMDRHFAELLRRSGRPIVLVGNKSETKASRDGLLETYALGFGEPVPISAEHGDGLGHLRDAILDHWPEHAPRHAEHITPHAEHGSGAAEHGFGHARHGADATAPDATEIPADIDDDGDIVDAELPPETPLKVAILGRPNAGKSTLVNRMIGEDRLLTGPEAGITRDTIAIPWDWRGRKVELFDTAGIRRRARVQEKLEKLSVADGLRAVRFAEVVVLLLDAGQPFEKQDLQLADMVEKEGRGLVIALNKWDLVENGPARRRVLEEECARLLPQLKGVPLVTVSGFTGRGIDRVMEAALNQWRIWNRRIPTGKLNRWFSAAMEANAPPAVSGRRIKMRFLTQPTTRPPTFVTFCSRPDAVPDSYRRYLVNGLRETFALDGVPIRLILRQKRNPFDKG